MRMNLGTTLTADRADDGVRTRDLNLGKVPRYQLRYIRVISDTIT